jgi:hypothetical protein
VVGYDREVGAGHPWELSHAVTSGWDCLNCADAAGTLGNLSLTIEDAPRQAGEETADA